jgi:glucuronate isomerase
MLIDQKCLFPSEAGTRKIAKTSYGRVRTLPIISPHGLTRSAWWRVAEHRLEEDEA